MKAISLLTSDDRVALVLVGKQKSEGERCTSEPITHQDTFRSTSFGLYRDGTELRGLYANKSDVALAACASLGDKCDYAILLGWDSFTCLFRVN